MSADKGRVLVIDDDVDFLDSTEATLASAGYEVVTAKTGEEGYAQACEKRPDVIVLDLMLEHTDTGFSLAHKIRRTPELADVPMIMVTSVARETGFRFNLAGEDERRWIKVNQLLHKPVTGADLLARIAEVRARASA